jgi:phosphoglycerate dehydrogenase-like enzyme
MTSIALEPAQPAQFIAAIESAGGSVAPLSAEVKGLVWTDYHRPDLLRQVLSENPQLTWVQLPFAGVDAFVDILDAAPTFTCAKGSYSQPVAEHALALMLALGRTIPERVRATTWGDKFAVSLYESKVLIVGGGGITAELLRLLQPFGCPVTVVRNSSEPMPGATLTVGLDELNEHLPDADFVVVAAALTPQTLGLFDSNRFAKMKPTAYLVNIARGKHVVTDDLIIALNTGQIAAAALDVTDPEPLPDGHPLWNLSNCLITPHTADTPAQVTRMLAERIAKNVEAFCTGGEMVGLVNKTLGY